MEIVLDSALEHYGEEDKVYSWIEDVEVLTEIEVVQDLFKVVYVHRET